MDEIVLLKHIMHLSHHRYLKSVLVAKRSERNHKGNINEREKPERFSSRKETTCLLFAVPVRALTDKTAQIKRVERSPKTVTKLHHKAICFRVLLFLSPNHMLC